MIPPGMQEFIVGTLTASASFIGLLFVAISFTMTDKDTPGQLRTKRILAESSNRALLNIFFLSLIALVPGINIGYALVVLYWGGIGNAAHFLRVERKRSYNRGLLTFTSLIYIIQAIWGITIIIHGHHYTSKYGLLALMIFSFSAALERAWELTGIRGDHNNRP